MKIALVYDRVNKYGGAERVLEALHEIWPEAPLYTSVYDPKGAPWARGFDVRTSFLQKIPFASTNHEFFAWATPLAFESFTFDEYDVVVSITSAEAKGIITKPHTLHICYCLTPTRYLWSGRTFHETTQGIGSLGLRLWAPHLRRWDRIAAARPDRYIAISEHVAKRIKKYYKQDSEVIYPPVITSRFKPQASLEKGEFYLVVSRLVGYKRVDIAIDACSKLKLPLVVIGEGNQKKELMGRAGATIRFVGGHLTDRELLSYYQSCRAFIHVADEEFGIAMVEAQAAGKPVLAFKKSAASEIVISGQTGVLFDTQSSNSLMGALNKSRRMRFDAEVCSKNALRFGKNKFKEGIKGAVALMYSQYTKT